MTDSPTHLVFLPGLLCDAAIWNVQAAALADVIPSTILNLTRDDSIVAMAMRTLEECPKQFALAALSMGGYVALEILRQAPERVTRLALFDTNAGPDSARRAAQRRSGIESAQQGRFAGVTSHLLLQIVHPSRVNGSVGDEVKAMARRVGKDAFLRQQHAILHRPDSRPMLKSIRVPTLVAVGDGDQLSPPAIAEEMHWSIPRSKFHVFNECGHLPPMELPDETTRLLRRWLTAEF